MSWQVSTETCILKVRVCYIHNIDIQIDLYNLCSIVDDSRRNHYQFTESILVIVWVTKVRCLCI